MKNQFADYETSRILKELGFDEHCMALYTPHKLDYPIVENYNNSFLPKVNSPTQLLFTAPLWQQVKEWLWKNKNYSLTVRMIGTQYTYEIWNDKTKRFIEYGVKYDSPIEAEIDGIKSAVEILYSQTAVAVTPINTSANGA